MPTTSLQKENCLATDPALPLGTGRCCPEPACPFTVPFLAHLASLPKWTPRVDVSIIFTVPSKISARFTATPNLGNKSATLIREPRKNCAFLEKCYSISLSFYFPIYEM